MTYHFNPEHRARLIRVLTKQLNRTDRYRAKGARRKEIEKILERLAQE